MTIINHCVFLIRSRSLRPKPHGAYVMALSFLLFRKNTYLILSFYLGFFSLVH
ncbi:hypothetical protein PO909_015008 [Leuciscus waleckii]